MYDASAMKRTHQYMLLFCAACAIGTVAATEEDGGVPPLRDLPDFDSISTEETNTAEEEISAFPDPNTETLALIQNGIQLQIEVLKTLQSIKDRKTADSAARDILKLATDLKIWGSKLDARPLEDETIMEDYERNLLPEIRRISNEIKKESERIATYGYFGSQLLYESLVELVRQAQ